MKAKQRIVIRTEPRRRRVARNGLIEHAAHDWTVDVLAADAESDDAAGKHVDDHQNPMAAKKDRLAAKQIHAPEAVLGLRDEGEPRGAPGAWMFRAVMSCEDPTDDILIDLHTECMRDLLSDALITESGIAKLHLEDGRDDFLSRSLRAWLAPDSGGREQ